MSISPTAVAGTPGSDIVIGGSALLPRHAVFRTAIWSKRDYACVVFSASTASAICRVSVTSTFATAKRG